MSFLLCMQSFVLKKGIELFENSCLFFENNQFFIELILTYLCKEELNLYGICKTLVRNRMDLDFGVTK